MRGVWGKATLLIKVGMETKFGFRIVLFSWAFPAHSNIQFVSELISSNLEKTQKFKFRP